MNSEGNAQQFPLRACECYVTRVIDSSTYKCSTNCKILQRYISGLIEIKNKRK